MVVEICLVVFYLDDDFGVLVSVCLFGDGVVVMIWCGYFGFSGLWCSVFSMVY